MKSRRKMKNTKQKLYKIQLQQQQTVYERRKHKCEVYLKKKKKKGRKPSKRSVNLIWI